MEIFLIFLVLLFLFYCWLKERENYWSKRGFQSASFVFPFGSLKGIGTEKSLCIGLDDLYKKFKNKGPAVGLFSFTKPILLLVEPSLIKNVLVTNFESFPDRSIYFNKIDDPLSGHLLALEGKEWKERRVMLTPTFTTGKIKAMFEIIDDVSEQFVQLIRDSIKSETSKLEMQEIVACYTTDTISNVAFGLDSNSLKDPNSNMRKYGKEIIDFGAAGFLKFFFTSSFPGLSQKLHLTANKQCVIDFFLSIFKSNIEYREKNGIFRKDFLQILLELKRKNSLSVNEMAAHSFIFFLGGFETSSSLMTFALYELASNANVQEKLRKEILDAMKENDGKLSYDNIFELKYLDMVINETLRKYPPAFLLLRKSNTEFRIPDSDLVIPDNTDIYINIYSLHNDPEYFPNPSKFLPERFSQENVNNIVPYTFQPFGSGQRACIGKRFGLLQSKMGIARLIQNFKFSLCDESGPLDFVKPTFFLAPSNKMWLNVKQL